MSAIRIHVDRQYKMMLIYMFIEWRHKQMFKDVCTDVSKFRTRSQIQPDSSLVALARSFTSCIFLSSISSDSLA